MKDEKQKSLFFPLKRNQFVKSIKGKGYLFFKRQHFDIAFFASSLYICDPPISLLCWNQ